VHCRGFSRFAISWQRTRSATCGRSSHATCSGLRAPISSRAAAVPWRVDPERSGGGFFFEGACHTFDILDFLFGPIVDVRAFAGTRPKRIVRKTS
jgi:predicted dehydrogenase